MKNFGKNQLELSFGVRFALIAWISCGKGCSQWIWREKLRAGADFCQSCAVFFSFFPVFSSLLSLAAVAEGSVCHSECTISINPRRFGRIWMVVNDSCSYCASISVPSASIASTACSAATQLQLDTHTRAQFDDFDNFLVTPTTCELVAFPEFLVDFIVVVVFLVVVFVVFAPLVRFPMCVRVAVVFRRDFGIIAWNWRLMTKCWPHYF